MTIRCYSPARDRFDSGPIRLRLKHPSLCLLLRENTTPTVRCANSRRLIVHGLFPLATRQHLRMPWQTSAGRHGVRAAKMGQPTCRRTAVSGGNEGHYEPPVALMIAVLELSKLAPVACPKTVMLATHAIRISASITAYSTDVGPSSSRSSCRKRFICDSSFKRYSSRCVNANNVESRGKQCIV
jgi:hypothetical protein